MKKFLHSLLMLVMGVTAVFAQQEEAVTCDTWDGCDLIIELGLGEKKTLMYTVPSGGLLYIYAETQTGKIPVSIEGGLWLDGHYDETAEACLQETDFYDGYGSGVYGWVKVWESDKIRFTLTAAEMATDENSELTEFTLKSLILPATEGSTNSNPIVLTEGKSVTLPTFRCESNGAFGRSHETYCKFTAPSTGLANIIYDEYEIFYVEEEKFDTEELQGAIEDATTMAHHEFMVETGKSYIVVIPNSRPGEVTFKMSDKQLGASIDLPYEISEFPVTLNSKNLVKGDHFYRFTYDQIGENTIMEVSVAEGWNGKITYFEANNWGAEESGEIVADTVTGKAKTTFRKNLDTEFLAGYYNALIVNFNMETLPSTEIAVELTLRKPEAGESFNTATTAVLGENTIEGSTGDYWFAYTSEADAVYSFETSGKLKHVNFEAGVEQMVENNAYRLHEGETIYVCVTTTTDGNNTLTVTSKEIVAGDYCDKPIEFELGNDITIEGRGIDNFHSFVAEGNGFAVFTSPGWSIFFREECGGRQLEANRIVAEIPVEGTKDSTTIQFTYKLPVLEGNNYIVELQAVSEEVVIATGFEAAVAGDVCATAIEIEALNDTIEFAYEFEKVKWYRFTADKDGFYAVTAKLGSAANLKTKVGDCEADETSADEDSSKPNAYMGGYKVAKVYVEEGETLYIYTKTGSENVRNGEDLYAKEFGTDFYLVVSYAGEARPGEAVAVAVKAAANTEYTVLKNDADGYEQWYTYTIPDGEAATIELAYSTLAKYTANNLTLYKEDMTNMSSWNGDYTQTNLTNEAGEVYGKRLEIPAADEARTIYIKVGTANVKFYPEPVVWKIICNDNTGGDDTSVIVEKADSEALVIYDLMGRCVENPTKGIYIINGVKRVIK